MTQRTDERAGKDVIAQTMLATGTVNALHNAQCALMKRVYVIVDHIFNRNNTNGLNLKCIQIRHGKKFNTVNELNLTETKKIKV